MNQYQIALGPTYYNQKYLNIGVVASNYLGNHNEALKIILLDGQIILSTINRTINKNGSVRFYGGIAWHQFIQDNYNLNNTINFVVTNPNTITILPNAQ
jgi:hypothetical protein